MYTEATQKYLRVSEIARDRKTGERGVLSISRATWWAWVKAGKAPQPIRLSAGVTVWRENDVIAFAESLAPSTGLPPPLSQSLNEESPPSVTSDETDAKRQRIRDRLRALRTKQAASQGRQ